MPEKKNVKLIRSILGLVLFAGLAVAAFLLDQQGVGLVFLYEQNSLMRALFVLFLCLGGYHVLMLLSILQIHVKNGNESEIGMLGAFNRVLTGLAILIGVAYVFGRIDAFTSFFTIFGGMLLGWSLQAPVSGFAAWVMVTLMRPYRTGDRVQFPTLGLIGDIVKFSSMYLTLNQVGGSIGSEDPVGRMVHVPNAMLFGQVVINYTHLKSTEVSSYILDEALFRVTLDSDWDTVETILLGAARAVTCDIIAKTGTQPYIRADTWDYGTLFRLRYLTDAVDRPRIMYEIVKNATKEIQRNRNVDLAIPYVYSFKRGLDGAKSATRPSDSIEQIDISLIHGIRLDDAQYWMENDTEVVEIAHNISEVGLLQPIVLTRDLEGDGYCILFGEKRLKACVLLGWTKVPAIVRNPIGIDINR
jgi:small-conductance mechanosensitive channel